MDERLEAKLDAAYRRDAGRVVRQTIAAAGVDQPDAEDALHDAVVRWIEREQDGSADVPARLAGLFLYAPRATTRARSATGAGAGAAA